METKEKVNGILEAAEIEAVSFFDRCTVMAARLESGEILLAADVVEPMADFVPEESAERCMMQFFDRLMNREAETGVLTKDQARLIVALSENNLSGTETAKKLGWGRTKLYATMKKIREKTGKDPLEFFGMCELLVMAREVLKED